MEFSRYSPVKVSYSDMSDVAGIAMPTGSGPRQVQLNPERAPALIAKWQKLLGKDLDKIEVVYDAEGVNVYLYGRGSFVKKDSSGEEISMSIAEFKAKKSEAAKPSDEEAVRAFKNKFEIRLNLPFPSDRELKSASEADIQAFLSERPFHERRAMLMTNKQFNAAYPNGFTAP